MTVFARLVLGYVVALPLIVPQTARYLGTPYSIAITMQSPTTGPLEAVHDLGGGFADRPFSTVALHPSSEPHEYKLELPPGRYHRFRIDPGTTAARYTITRVAILAPDESTRTIIPLAALAPLSQLSVVERSNDRLVLEAPSGSTDPQILVTPDAPVVVPSHVFNPVVPAPLTVAILVLCGIGAVRVVELLFQGISLDRVFIRAALLCRGRPRTAIAILATVATVVATYPVLLLGKSLFTPNIGAVPMLYGEAPFTPGSTDTEYEDPRGSDVWAAILQDVPHSIVQRAALAEGEIPLWNRHNAAGRPLWGQGLSFLLDPLHWLTLITPDATWGSDLKFVAHRLVFTVGVGLAALAATGAVFPAMIAAATAAFAGVYAFRLNHPGIFVLTYAPWVLLGWFSLASATDRRSRARAALLIAIGSALLMFAANPKDAAVTLPGLWLAGTIAVLLSEGSWRERALRLVAAAFAGLVSVLITAPQWLIFLDTLSQAFTVYDYPYANFAIRQHATGFFLGPLTAGPALTGLNLLALVLIVAALTAPGRFVARRQVFACGIVAAVLIVVAFGLVPASVVVRIPMVRNIGHIHDTFLTAVLPLLLIVVAWGAHVLLTAGLLRTSCIALVGAVASWWLFADVGRYLRGVGFAPGAVLLMAPVVVTIPWCFYVRQKSPGRVLPQTTLAAAIVALLLPNGLHLESGIPVVDELLIQPRTRAPLEQHSPVLETVHRSSTEPARTVGVNWTLIESSHSIYGLEGIGGADPLEVDSYKRLVDAASMWRSMWVTVVWNKDAVRLSPFLDLLNVGFAVGRSDTALPPGVVEIPMSRPDRLKVGRRPSAWPRAFFVDGVTTYDTVPDLLNKVSDVGRPFAAVQTTDGEASSATRDLTMPSGDVVPATRYRLTTNTTSFAVRAPSAGVAVLSETFLPDDFHATLNGASVPYFRVNQAFKAVKIPSRGDWIVKFEYRPVHWELSLGLAGIGLVLLAGVGLAARAARYAVETTLSDNPALRASS
jgi:hypothetical protein